LAKKVSKGVVDAHKRRSFNLHFVNNYSAEFYHVFFYVKQIGCGKILSDSVSPNLKVVDPDS
jgi:hypothetical protein